jgi:hypothetical protein
VSTFLQLSCKTNFTAESLHIKGDSGQAMQIFGHMRENRCMAYYGGLILPKFYLWSVNHLRSRPCSKIPSAAKEPYTSAIPSAARDPYRHNNLEARQYRGSNAPVFCGTGTPVCARSVLKEFLNREPQPFRSYRVPSPSYPSKPKPGLPGPGFAKNAQRRDFRKHLPFEQVHRLFDVGDPEVAGQRRMFLRHLFIHGIRHVAVGKVPGSAAAQL